MKKISTYFALVVALAALICSQTAKGQHAAAHSEASIRRGVSFVDYQTSQRDLKGTKGSMPMSKKSGKGKGSNTPKGSTTGNISTTTNTCSNDPAIVDYEQDFESQGEDAGAENYIGTTPSKAILDAWSATKDRSAAVRGQISLPQENGETFTGTFLINTSTAVKVEGKKITYSGVYVEGQPGVLYYVECRENKDTCSVFIDKNSPDLIAANDGVESNSRRLVVGQSCSSDSQCEFDELCVNTDITSGRGSTCQCVFDTACTSGALLFCVPLEGCQECRDNSHCRDPGKPFCKNAGSPNSCVQCLRPSEGCPKGKTCSIRDSRCVDPSCFSALSFITVLGKGQIPIKDLKIGDSVEIKPGIFSLVYSFGHRDETNAAEFLQIHITGHTKPLEASAEHLLFSENNAVPASAIRVGDWLDLISGDVAKVHHIEKITRFGVYSPFTISGTLVVDGITASCYPSYQESGYMEIGGYKTPMTHHSVSHAFLAPLRMMCSMNLDMCKQETYTNGISDWVYTAFHVSTWVLHQHAFIQMLSLSLLIPFLVTFGLIEKMFFTNGIATSICLIIAIILIVTKCTKSKIMT